ncbi:TPA: glycosyltransferase family 9 protein [Pasteurella multocida]
MKIKGKLRIFRIQIGKLFLDKKTAPYQPKKSIESILFLRQDGKIGDYIVSSFVFREIKKFNPKIKIGVICTKKNAYLFRQNQYIDQLYYVKKRSIIDYIKCGLSIAKEKYNLVIDPTVMIRNRDLLLLRLINATNYIGYQKANYGLFNINLEGDFHFSELYKLALEETNITIQDMTYDVPFDAQSAVEIDKFLQENQLEKYIAINFYGASRSRKFNKENIKAYLLRISGISNNKPIILLNYPEVVEELQEIAMQYRHIFLYPTTNIFQTIELIKYCDQLISPDTSTVHIASGFNKPIIAFYKKEKINFMNWQPKSKAETHILFYKENINELSPEQIDPAWLVR